MSREVNADIRLCETVLKAENQCHIGLSDNDEPYVVPLSYGYREGVLYFHSSNSGMKLDLARKNPRTAFSVSHNVELVPAEKACKFSINFASVIGYGKIEFVNENGEKRRALDIISLQHGATIEAFPDEVLSRVTILKLVIEQMTFKTSD